jgi:hypothetical protein
MKPGAMRAEELLYLQITAIAAIRLGAALGFRLLFRSNKRNAPSVVTLYSAGICTIKFFSQRHAFFFCPPAERLTRGFRRDC